jgi:branched-chain amino acid transport system substrate-binding protein
LGLRRSLFRLLPVALGTALLLAGCGRAERQPPPWRAQLPTTPAAPAPALVPQGPPTVGLLVPLTGSAAKLGADFQAAAEMALFDVGDSTLQLVPRDTGDSPEGAVKAANEALEAGAQLLLGPLFGRSTAAVAPVASSRGVSVLSFSNDATIVAPGVYVLGFRPEEQVARIVDYAGRRGLTRFAAVVPDDAYGAATSSAWRAAVSRLPGARLVGLERYSAREPDPAAALRRLAGAPRPPVAAPAPPAPSGAPSSPVLRPTSSLPPFDSLLIADGGTRLRSVVSTLPTFNVAGGNTRLLGTLRWQEDPSLLSEQPAQGAWIATWSKAALDKFAQRFEATYKRKPNPLAVLAYDATALASLLAKGDNRFAAEQLTDPQGFTGGSGLFRLRPDGLAEHGLDILEVRNGTVRVIDAAPTSFPGGLASR